MFVACVYLSYGKVTILEYCFLSLYMQAFFEGKLKIAGNTALAMKLQTIIKPPKSKL